MTKEQAAQIVQAIQEKLATGEITAAEADQDLMDLEGAVKEMELAEIEAEPMDLPTSPMTMGTEDMSMDEMQGAGQYAGRLAEVATGAAPARLAAAQAMGADYSLDELLDMALKLDGSFPSGEEIVNRTGTGKGSPVLQTAASVALDAADPAVLLGLGGLIKKGVQAGGKKIFQSGLKNVDKAVQKAGKDFNAYSDTLFRHGIAGTSESMVEQADALADKLYKEQRSILEAAANAGAVVDPQRAFNPVLLQAQKIATSGPGGRATLKSVKGQAQNFLEEFDGLVRDHKYRPEMKEGPTQVPAFFEHELPTRGTATKSEMVVDVDQPLTGTPGSPDQGDMFRSHPEHVLGANARRGQMPLFSRDSVTAAQTPVSAETVQYQQALMDMPKGQQNLLRPSDIMAPKAPIIPASGGVAVDDFSDIKSQIYDLAGDDAYSKLKRSDVGEKLMKRAGRRAKLATELAVKKVDPAAAKRLKELNSDLGALLSGREAMFGEFSKEVTRNAVTPVDMALGILNPKAAMSKKMGDLAKGAYVRTSLGKLLNNRGVSAAAGVAGTAATKQAIPSAYEYLMLKLQEDEGKK